MTKKHYFIGFRKEFRDRLAATMGVEATPLKPEEVVNHLFGNIYLRSFKLISLRPHELISVLETCQEEKTKFVCFEEGFCFDGAAKIKQLRHTSLVQAKYPEIGHATLGMLKDLDLSYYLTKDEMARRSERIDRLLDLIGTSVTISIDMIGELADASNETIRTLRFQKMRRLRLQRNIGNPFNLADIKENEPFKKPEPFKNS